MKLFKIISLTLVLTLSSISFAQEREPIQGHGEGNGGDGVVSQFKGALYHLLEYAQNKELENPVNIQIDGKKGIALISKV